jgi:hypothetical protein
MPFLSKRQARWGHSPSGLRALGGEEAVKEWDSETDFAHLPDTTGIQKEKVRPMAEKKPKKFIGPAIKHPGSLRAAAKRRGVSTLQEAEHESHSSNKKIRSRGNLGKTLIESHGFHRG